jgi:hypothetical protein
MKKKIKLNEDEKKKLADEIRSLSMQFESLLDWARTNDLKVILVDGSSKGIFNNFDGPAVHLRVHSISSTQQY